MITFRSFERAIFELDNWTKVYETWLQFYYRGAETWFDRTRSFFVPGGTTWIHS